MKYLRNVLILALLVMTGFLVIQTGQVSAFDPFHTSATPRVGPVCNVSGSSGAAGCGTYTANPFIGNNGIIVSAALLVDWIVGITSVVVMLYAGFQFINSRGDTQKALNARSTMLYAAIGLLVAVMAQAIIAFALNRTLT